MQQKWKSRPTEMAAPSGVDGSDHPHRAYRGADHELLDRTATTALRSRNAGALNVVSFKQKLSEGSLMNSDPNSGRAHTQQHGMSNRILVAIGIAFVLALLVLIYAVAGNERTASNSSSPSATTGQSKNRPRSRTRKQRRPRRLSRGKTAPH